MLKVRKWKSKAYNATFYTEEENLKMKVTVDNTETTKVFSHVSMLSVYF
jgi:hypothetical protein